MLTRPLHSRRERRRRNLNVLAVQANLVCSYEKLGRIEEALQMRRDIYSGRLKLNGDSHEETLLAANNYAYSLIGLKRFEGSKSVLRKSILVARRVLGESNNTALRLRLSWNYARALYEDGATLDDLNLREAITTLDDTDRIARRVLGGSHPLTAQIEQELQIARAILRAREAPRAA